MKLLLLVGCLVVGALGGALYPAAGGLAGGAGGVGGIGGAGGVGGIGGVGGVGGVGVGGVVPGPGVGRAAGTQRHWINTANAAQKHAAEVQDHGRNDGNYGDSAARSAAKAQQAGSHYGSRAANWDQNNKASKRVADQAAASSWDANKWGARNDANRALNDQILAQGNQWYKGRRNNDNIDYAYDKKFDLRDTENGGFVFSDSESSHALDDVRDRAAAYDRNVDKDAAWASAADAQKADRKSAWAQNAAAGDSSWDKFARNSANAASANGHSKDWAEKLDQSQGANRQWHDARKTASDIYKDLATADGSYKRNAKAFGGRGGAYGDNVYAYGLAGAGGVAAKPGYYQPDGRVGYAKGGAAGDAAQAWDQAAKLGLRQTEGAASEDNTKAAYSRDKWLNHRERGFDRDHKSASDDKGFSDWARQSAKAANKYDAASADAASKWNKDQSRSRFNEDLWKKEAEKKRVSDRDHNKKVYKKWFNNKNRGGDNWERLKYDRNQNDDAFGYETAAKKDWAQTASDNRWNEHYDANARDSKAARAASAARDASNSDWKKEANGWQNANAATSQRDGASRRGYNNEQWKKNQLKDVRDARTQNTGQWHLGADRAGGARGGVVGGAVGGAVGVVGGAGYPAGGYGYGYPVNGGVYGGSPRGYGSGYGYVYAPKGGYGKGYYY